jgi:glycosyltransferase involved in cell wall biosynthesis
MHTVIFEGRSCESSMAPSKFARVLEICSYPPPHAGWGVRVAFVRRHLEASGHHCQVLNTGKSRKRKASDCLDVQSGYDYLTKVIRHAKDGYLIHSHLNGDSLKGLLLVLIAELVGVLVGRRCVLTFHAGPEQRFFPVHRSRLLAPLYLLAFALPQTIICNSNLVKAAIQTYGIRAEKIVPIPAFSRQYLAFERVALKRNLEEFLSRHRPVVVAYIFLRPEFFVEPLIQSLTQAALELPDMGVVLIGADTQSDRATRMLEEAGLRDRAFQAGDLSHDECMTLMSRAHLFVRTPKKDGVSSSVLEALSLKIPVIASENGSRPAGVITFNAGDAADLAKKIRTVWKAYPRVRAELVAPTIRDTVQDEARLLIKLAIEPNGHKAPIEVTSLEDQRAINSIKDL